ncbi:hypothetical protein Rhe02_80640 [Rhizocola hellebori]|uniref:Beta-lactamase class A catalytic domain-containing protein n=1 Tax=Rhizocola hellebori TaxID=1392758 RepID=A0A8J3QHZ5_9ACTN|nr:serine hydrolase [Rhizocola hellebori]GIH09997.1 hypothetical protein Rhe02_80640 [Rhizocola hellebori]
MARRLPAAIAIATALAVGLGVLVPKALAAQHPATSWVTRADAPAPPVGGGTAGGGPAGQSGSPQSTVAVNFSGEFLGWAMLDRTTGSVIGENLDKTSSTESMIKTWVVADHLRRAAAGKAGGPTPNEVKLASDAIKWSDDDAAQTLYERTGGNESIERMITMCGLTDTTVYDDWWSRTQMSPRDAVRLGECLANGTAAGPAWTTWLLQEMRQVSGTTAATEQQSTRGGGRWGIIDGVPAAQANTVAIKNGWTSYRSDGNWHINCLAVTDSWSMAVMMRYPSSQGLDYGAGVCESIAAQLLT